MNSLKESLFIALERYYKTEDPLFFYTASKLKKLELNEDEKKKILTMESDANRRFEEKMKGVKSRS